jgi:multidrug efflux system membrane fusion protein
MIMGRIGSIGAILTCVACIALGVMQGCARSPAQAGAAAPPPPVTTQPVTVADVPDYLNEIGRTTASEIVTITPQVSGKIIQRSFADGADLKEGQALFQIDPRPFEASLHAAQATLEQTQAQLSNAQTDFNRIDSLLSSKAVAQQDYDNAFNAVAVDQANVKSAQASLETARLNLEYCTIKSPLDGRAGERLVDVGNVVNANSTALLVIQKIVPIYADFTIPENRLDEVRRDMKAQSLMVIASSPSAPNTPAEGTLQFLDNAVQDGTGTIKLRALIVNKDEQFWPGQFVNVQLILATMKDAKLVPNQSVQIGQQGPYVFVVNDKGLAEQRPVTLGQRQGSNVVIEQGLTGDETVIYTGQMMVQPGLPVTVLKPATQPSGAQASAGTGS